MKKSTTTTTTTSTTTTTNKEECIVMEKTTVIATAQNKLEESLKACKKERTQLNSLLAERMSAVDEALENLDDAKDELKMAVKKADKQTKREAVEQAKADLDYAERQVEAIKAKILENEKVIRDAKRTFKKEKQGLVNNDNSTEEQNNESAQKPIECDNTFTQLISAIELNGCLLVNYTGTEITNPKAWYTKTKKESQVTVLNLNANRAEISKQLAQAVLGFGVLAHTAVVVSVNNKLKVPKAVLNVDVLSVDKNTKEYDLSNPIQESLKNVPVDKTAIYLQELVDKMLKKLTVEEEKEKERQAYLEKRAKEDGKILNAKRLRASNEERKSIYKGTKANYDVYDMVRDLDDTAVWSFTHSQNRVALSEFLRAVIKETGISIQETGKFINQYRLGNVLQLNFEPNFAQAQDFKYVYRTPDGKAYVDLSSLEVTMDDVDIVTGERTTLKGYRELTSDEIINVLPEGTQEFINISHGASGIRGNASFYLLNDDKIENILDCASRGMYSRFKGKSMKISKIVKANTRILASTAPSKVLYKVDSFAVYVEKFGIGEKDDANTKEFQGKKKALDGIAYSIFRNMQARLGSSKIFASRVTLRLMKLMIQFFDKNPIILEVGKTPTAEQEAIMAAAFDDDNKEVMINGQLVNLEGRVIVCKKAGSLQDTPEYFSDLNGFKANFNIAEGFEVPVLDMPKKNSANSSTQFLNKVIAAGGQKAVQLVLNRIEEHLDKLITNFTADSELNIKDLNDPYLAGIIGKAVPEFMKRDLSIRRSNVKLLLNSISNTLNNMRFPIKDSANGRAIPDIAGLFGLSLLNDNEFYSVDVKANTLCILIKYPTIGLTEFWKATCVGYEELCRRIDALEVPEALKDNADELKQELKTYYRTMAPGCAVMPNSKAIMAGLAGMDFDYDMIIAIYDKDFVALFKDTKAGVIHIMNSSVDTTIARKFSYLIMSDPQLANMAKEQATVGGVTNNYGIIILFMLSCKLYRENTNALRGRIADKKALGKKTVKSEAKLADRIKVEHSLVTDFAAMIDHACLDAKKAAEIVKKHAKLEMASYDFKGTKPSIDGQVSFRPLVDRSNNSAYEPIGEGYAEENYIYMPVSTEQKERAEEQMRTCRIETLEDVFMICADIIRIARNDQEITIDSAKTSISATIVLNFNRMFNVFSKVEYLYDVDRDTNEIYREVSRPHGQTGNLGRKFYIYDVFAAIRDKAEDYIIPKVQEILTNYAVPQEEILASLGSFEGMPGVDTCMRISKIYGSIAYRNAMNPHFMDSKTAQKYYKAIHYLIKAALGEDSAIAKSGNALGKFVYWLSCVEKDSNNKVNFRTEKTSFNSLCFPVETILYAYLVCQRSQRVCEPVTVIEDAIVENQKLVFINGDAVNEEGRVVAVAKEFLNGEFTMMKVNGKYFACDRVTNYISKNDYDKSHVVFTLKGNVTTINENDDITFTTNRHDKKGRTLNSLAKIGNEYYESTANAIISVIAKLGKAIQVEHSIVTEYEDQNNKTQYQTIVLAKVIDAQEEVSSEDNEVEAYAYDPAYAPTEEEQEEVYSFNPMDFGFDATDFDDEDDIEFSDAVEFED